MPGQRRRVIAEYRELLVVAVAAALGLTVQSPLRSLVHHQGIDILLVVLVFSTGLGIEGKSLRQLPTLWRQLTLAVLVGISLLPALSWLVAHFVAPGALRHGVETIGLAPCEIASIATTSMAGGEVALAGGVLVGSTIATVAAAGPILAAESSGASIAPGHIVVNLLLIVAAPLVVGVAVAALIRLPPRIDAVASNVSALSVAALVALVASEVRLTQAYLSVLVAVVLFVAATAVVGRILGLGNRPPVRKAILLTISMRDFAIAAALATTAFGPESAAPLGLYGVVVLVWGTGSSGFMRARAPSFT
jgi:BASS family bile acid:Na+ symporter